MAAGDPALERPGAPVLGGQRVPVRRVPGLLFQWTLTSGLGAFGTTGGLVLWALELLAALLACAYLWELCDALGTEQWRRRVTRRHPGWTGGLPFVSLHVPAHNEPPEMVIETLTSLLRLDYPNYEIVVIDDNTDDEALWRPVADWCTQHAVTFFHLADWPGYKSGRAERGAARVHRPAGRAGRRRRLRLPARPGLPAPVRAAVRGRAGRVHPGAAGLPGLAAGVVLPPALLLVQVLLRDLAAVPQRARRRDLRRHHGPDPQRALEELGGWDEWCITEDAELSLRLLRAGWSGLHVDESSGTGVMPLTFEALKSQRYRWCFGGIQILRMHWRSMLPGRADRRTSWARRSAGPTWPVPCSGTATCSGWRSSCCCWSVRSTWPSAAASCSAS